MRRDLLPVLFVTWGLVLSARVLTQPRSAPHTVAQEVVVARHLADGDEQTMTAAALIGHGRHLFTWIWTARDGAGRAIVSGADPAARAPRAAGPSASAIARPVGGADSTSCARCHHQPFGVAGGGGAIVARLPSSSPRPTPRIAVARATVGLFGAGFLEMLARQISTDLRAIRDRLEPGQSAVLTSKGLSFGTLARGRDGSWDTRQVIGLAGSSLASAGPRDPPPLIVRPFQQDGAAISLRQVTIDAFELHHGLQSVERVGRGADPDGDGVADELTRADITAVAAFAATLAVPGRVVPTAPAARAAVRTGERLFAAIGCTRCHVAALPLDRRGWIYSEPNPFNAPGTLQPGEAPAVSVDLTSDALPQPRLAPVGDVVWVPAYTDFRLHDITGDDRADEERADEARADEARADHDRRFLTKRLWGAASDPPFCHDGRCPTLRAAIAAHAGEALAERRAFEAQSTADQEAIVAFLDSLRVLPPGTRHLVVDERGQPATWPPAEQAAARRP